MFWRGLIGYLPANIVHGLVGVLTLLFFTRLLSAEDFGRYALAFSVMSLAHVCAFTWIEAAMARFWAAQHSPQEMRAHFATLYRTFGLLNTPDLSGPRRRNRHAPRPAGTDSTGRPRGPRPSWSP